MYLSLKYGVKKALKLVVLILLLLVLRLLKLYELIMAHTGIWYGVVCVLKTKEKIQTEGTTNKLLHGKA